MRTGLAQIALFVASLASFWCSLAASAQEAAIPSATATISDGDGNSEASIEARKLFLEGRALLDQGQAHSACELLERSYKLVQALGTLLNLGLCHRYSGRMATAHDYYRQAEVAATLLGDTVRREFAHDEAASIAARRATLTLRISSEATAGLEVLLDEVPKARQLWSRPMFIDAGEHRILVRAPHKEVWQGTVSVTDGGQHLVVIPELGPQSDEASGSSEPSRRPVPPPRGSPELESRSLILMPNTREPHRDADSMFSTSRVAALSVGGAGVLSLGAGLAYAIAAQVAFDESEERCTELRTAPDRCSATGLQRRDDAHSYAARATVLAVSGGAAVLGGIVIWLLAPPGSPETARSLTYTTDRHGIAAHWTIPL